MKRIIIILLVLLLSACAPMQPAATATPFQTLSPTITATTPTFTHTATATLEPMPMAPMDDFMKGVAYVDWSVDDYSSIGSDRTISELIQPLGVTWIEIMLSCKQVDKPTTKILCEPSVGTPSDASLRHVVRKAKENGLRVMLKPQILFDFSAQESIPSIEGVSGTEAAWAQWFSNYMLMITHYAKLAQEEGVDAFNIGTELTHTSYREEDWRNVVKAIRSDFYGPLVYGANWDEAEKIQWWDAVDYIGVDAYFPLTNKLDPTVDELTNAWSKYVLALENLSIKWDRQIIITEIGYKSVDGANTAPYDYKRIAEIDLQEQADCYSAFFKAFLGKSWWRGVFFWEWNVGPNQGGDYDPHYTVHNKPAEEVLRLTYGGIQPTLTSTIFVPDYENTYEIFSGQLTQGWENYSWESEVDVSSTQVTYLEKPTIKVDLKSDGGFSLWSEGFDAKEYASLEFYIYHANHANRKLNLIILGSDDKVPPVYLRASLTNPELIDNASIVLGEWFRVRIPLSYLMEPVGIIKRINIQDISGLSEGDFYLAEIRLVGSKE
jgi:hypothetical protein